MGNEVEQLFSKGSRVEVSSDDEGFKGAWYVATVVEQPTNKMVKKTKRNTHKKFLVEYETLLADDMEGSKPLRDYVHASFLRPSPPETTHDDYHYLFELNDVVDAFYRDGWWTGVITGVVDDDDDDSSSRFVVFFQNPPEEKEFSRSELRVHRDWVDGKWVRSENQETTQQKVGTLGNQKIKKRRKSIARKSPVGVIKKSKSEVERFHASATNSQDALGGKKSEAAEMGAEPKDVEIVIDKMPSDISDDKPLLHWLQGMHSQTFMDGSRVLPGRTLNQSGEASDRQEENATLSPAIAANGDGMDKNQSLPFVKCFPLWKTIESMEVFQKTPQKPHFSPLENCQEPSREGLAISYMVTFANVVESTSKLQFSDPRNIIDIRLQTLADLETHGFDVEAVRFRLDELLSKKDREGQLQDELKEVESEIVKCNIEKTKVENEINDINVMMRELAEKLALVMSQKETKEKEIATLQPKRDVICEDIRNAQLDFERLVASPW